MNSREQFEAKFPVPAGVAWKDGIGMYEVVDLWKLDKEITIDRYNSRWEGWQASRTALAIELPNRFAEKYQDYYDDVEGGCFNEARYINDLTAAIEAAGVKVKS